jgi:hypothetical protein
LKDGSPYNYTEDKKLELFHRFFCSQKGAFGQIIDGVEKQPDGTEKRIYTQAIATCGCCGYKQVGEKTYFY